MKRIFITFRFLMIIVISSSCQGYAKVPVPGAWQTSQYLDLIEGMSVAVVANQTSTAGKLHLIDKLIEEGIEIKTIFAPEHGFRELADAGQVIENGSDPVSGVKIISLYGSNKKPSDADLQGIDVVIFDIQDVGARFYTYISTLHYIMEACAGNDIRLIILDRPNPNGFYSDGNIPDMEHRSFVCMHPVPVVYGMTIGEYAQMINGEGWLQYGVQCELTVIKCKNYTHNTLYELPVKPSPNLPNQLSIYLYPSICFFEGTNVSLGRGTPFPFQVYGSPLLPDNGFSFTPESLPGAKNPPLLGVRCFGTDLRDALKDKLVPAGEINLDWILEAYNNYPDKDNFFTRYFDVLAGGPVLREQIEKGMTAREIRETWRDGLEKFRVMRNKYLLYR